MREYYVIDRRNKEIVNCITTDRILTDADISSDCWENAEFLYLDEKPPHDMLLRYRFWDDRP